MITEREIKIFKKVLKELESKTYISYGFNNILLCVRCWGGDDEGLIFEGIGKEDLNKCLIELKGGIKR